MSCRRDAPSRQDRPHRPTVRWCAVWERRTNPQFDYRFYDSLSRLIEADYNNGATVYNYGYDVAGNLVDYDGVSRTYNAANQMTNDGTNNLAYDDNGNLRGDGTAGYTWDAANRLKTIKWTSPDAVTYSYDGLGNRIQQVENNTIVTDYLNDVQPGLTKLLVQDDGTNVEKFIHGVRGIHAVDDGTDWNFYAQDGLGSVRAVVDDMAVVQSSMSFDPYGNPMASYGSGVGYFGFTGEQTDANGSVFLRARYYEPGMGTFIKRDPAETPNRYAYVSGNPINRIDPTGLFAWHDYVPGEGYLIEAQDSIACIARDLHMIFNHTTVSDSEYASKIQQFISRVVSLNRGRGVISSQNNNWLLLGNENRLLLPDSVPEAGLNFSINTAARLIMSSNRVQSSCPANQARHQPTSITIPSFPSLDIPCPPDTLEQPPESTYTPSGTIYLMTPAEAVTDIVFREIESYCGDVFEPGTDVLSEMIRRLDGYDYRVDVQEAMAVGDIDFAVAILRRGLLYAIDRDGFLGLLAAEQQGGMASTESGDRYMLAYVLANMLDELPQTYNGETQNGSNQTFISSDFIDQVKNQVRESYEIYECQPRLVNDYSDTPYNLAE